MHKLSLAPVRPPKFPAERHRPDVASIDCRCRIACGRLRNPRRRHPFHLVRPTYSPRRTCPKHAFRVRPSLPEECFPGPSFKYTPLVETLSSSRRETMPKENRGGWKTCSRGHKYRGKRCAKSVQKFASMQKFAYGTLVGHVTRTSGPLPSKNCPLSFATLKFCRRGFLVHEPANLISGVGSRARSSPHRGNSNRPHRHVEL